MKTTLFVDGIETNYWIDSEGFIINKTTNKNILIRDDGQVQISVNKKSKKRTYSYLAAKHFLDNPNNYHLTTYIDGNKLNRHISNIKWISDKENGINTANKRRENKNYKITGIQENIVDNNYTKICDMKEQPPLQWKQLYDNIFISNDGQCRRNNRILTPYRGNRGYMIIELNNQKYSLHILVWKLFGSELYDNTKIINHINGDKTDNRICNLEQITQAANVQHAIHELHHGIGKYVGEFDDNGYLLQIYDNASDAARAIGILPSSMRNTIHRNGKCHNGLTYRYLE